MVPLVADRLEIAERNSVRKAAIEVESAVDCNKVKFAEKDVAEGTGLSAATVSKVLDLKRLKKNAREAMSTKPRLFTLYATIHRYSTSSCR